MLTLLILTIALLIDRVVGDPEKLWAKVPHPVVLFGKAISFFEKQFNGKGLGDRDRRAYGIMSIIALLIASIIVGVLVNRLLLQIGLLGIFIEILIVAVLLAQKSLADHVVAVASGFRDGGLQGGRRAVSMVVGRDPDTLDGPGVCRAAIETLAENFSDGVVAPALYYALFGLPGLFAYKMLNTADSMIGHKSSRYLHFGWASARLDDLANWPAARLSALVIAAGALAQSGKIAARRSLETALTDHGLHRSPNSGWPESAMAGALDIALAGPRIYAGERVQEPMQNAAGRRAIGPSDVDAAIAVFWRACTVFNLLVPITLVVSVMIC
ncbi:cobalamin biosynthesis protein [Rhizobium sp. KVB221]|uniref:Cobalamin biosynthesis protein CobD n=1 Tax=Rhizobium setariae TaxID=2801340 RepID=A0A937CLF9_9HYPH|nr:adenosylcobinamide-phosphate synthase CbiB [Rhizobium setariae]MBL0373145.1 cobalamin biosynthesis protein [Rhizobium setariae]